MRDQDKRDYLEKYREAKKNGIPFFPDALFKDAVVALGLFALLIFLSAAIGAVLDERADPTVEFDPEPEWYFLFLFQLLKYFPGSLEFVGVVVLPGIVIMALLALPWLDRSTRRHFTGRPVVISVTGLLAIGAIALTVVALVEEAPPSGVSASGDPVAVLYTANCSGCHGGTLTVPEGIDLVRVIAAGGHEGMPSWSADLSADEIDALAGFVVSPQGNEIFNQTCVECHDVTALVEAGPADLRSALEDGTGFAPHADVVLPPAMVALDRREINAVLNFLAAPDGQRLFTANCSSCHGSAVAFDGEVEELREIIRTGGEHLDMPAMGGLLSDEDITLLAEYVVSPVGNFTAEARALFDQLCSECHGSRVPAVSSVEVARTAIVTGGGHETMPVWGEILTAEQLDALTTYTLEAARGTPVLAGQEIYAQQCAVCHGDFGEGGINPANPANVLSPISTASYLQTRDDATIRAIIAQGQPDLGMSPFSLSFGGSLDEEDINAVVAFIRSWEADPPVELPPEIERAPLLGTGPEIYSEFCSQCHGVTGEGGIGPSFQDPQFHVNRTDSEMFTAIDFGHPATAMIAWGEVLTDSQISSLVSFIRTLEVPAEPPAGATTTTTQPPATDASFESDVLPIFQASCESCHGGLGGWSSDSYTAVMTTGNSAPVVLPGDPDGSLLVQLLQHPGGRLMPPGRALPADQIQAVVDWIAGGAPDN